MNKNKYRFWCNAAKDFKDWFQNGPEELPIIARNMIEHLKKENEMLWDMIDNVHSALNVSKYYE